MFKYLIPAIAVGLTFGCGIAHADAVDDAINAHAGQPGAVEYLNTVRALGDINFVEDVESALTFGALYCLPDQPAPLGTRAHRQALLTNLAWENFPGSAAEYLAAADTYCDAAF